MILVESFWYVRGKSDYDVHPTDIEKKEDNQVKLYKYIIDIFVYKIIILLPLIAALSLETTKEEGSTYTFFVVFISIYYLTIIAVWFVFTKIYSENIQIHFFGTSSIISRERKWKIIEIFLGIFPLLFINLFSKNSILNEFISEIDFTPTLAFSVLTALVLIFHFINIFIKPDARNSTFLIKFNFAILFSLAVFLVSLLIHFEEANTINKGKLEIDINLIRLKENLLILIYATYLITICFIAFYTNVKSYKTWLNEEEKNLSASNVK